MLKVSAKINDLLMDTNAVGIDSAMLLSCLEANDRAEMQLF